MLYLVLTVVCISLFIFLRLRYSDCRYVLFDVYKCDVFMFSDVCDINAVCFFCVGVVCFGEEWSGRVGCCRLVHVY